MATWPTIIDDDGSGTTGTVNSKALFDAIQAYIDGGGASAGAITGRFRLIQELLFPMPAATYPDFNPPNGAACPIWILQPSVPTTITGILAEPGGTTHLLVNASGNTITLASGNAGSAPANQFLCAGLANLVMPAWYSAVWVTYISGGGGVLKWVPVKV